MRIKKEDELEYIYSGKMGSVKGEKTMFLDMKALFPSPFLPSLKCLHSLSSLIVISL